MIATKEVFTHTICRSTTRAAKDSVRMHSCGISDTSHVESVIWISTHDTLRIASKSRLYYAKDSTHSYVCALGTYQCAPHLKIS
jgi:hypothetical protein